MKAPEGQSRFVLPLGYLLLGVAWIVGSDYLLGVATDVPDAAHWIASTKGILFVLATATLLFVVQSPRIRKMSAARLSSQSGASVLRPYLIFAIACIGVLVSGLMLYQQQATEVRQRADATLVNTANIAARQIENWLAGLRTKLDYAGRDPLLAHAILNRRSDDRDLSRPDVKGGLEVLRQSEGFGRVQVFSPSGEPIAHAGRAIALSDQLRFWIRGASSTGRVVMSDLYVPVDSDEGKPVLDFVVTVMHDDQPNVIAGVLVARVDPDRRLFQMLSEAVESSREISLILARRESDAVAELLPPTLRNAGTGQYERRLVAPGTAVQQVVTGQRDVVLAPDEQGTTVLATGDAIAGTPWTLIATVPVEVVFASHRRVGRLGLLLALVGLVVSGWLVVVWWRSEREAMAEQIDAAERRTSLVKEHFTIAGRFVHDIVLLIDESNATILEANDRAVQAYGYAREELLARTVFDLRPAGSAEQAMARERFSNLRTTHGDTYVTRHWRKDGSSFPIEISARFCELDGRQYVQIVGRDISERIESEARLAALSAERDHVLERLQRQFDQMAAACIVLSAAGDVLQINPAYETIFGHAADHVVGRNVTDFVKDEGFRAQIRRWLEQLRVDPDVTLAGDFENINASGNAIHCRWTATALRDDDGRFAGLIGMAEDVTERVAAERALRDSEERYRTLTQISPVGIFRTDLDGLTVFVNSRCCEIIGRSALDCLGLGWTRSIHADDSAGTTGAWRAYIESQGTVPYATEFRLVHPGARTVWVLAQCNPERDLAGVVHGHIGTMTDITALKAAQHALRQARDHLEDRVAERTLELEHAKNAAEHSDRVKSAFLSTMSHELRTPLNSILGFTDVLLQGLSGPLTEAQQRQLQIVRDSSSHLRALIEDVLDISRIEAGQIGLEFAEVDLADIVARRVEAFGPEYARKGIALRIETEGAVPRIRSDRKRAAQIVNNLLSNALKFTDQGSVTIRLCAALDQVEIHVIDTGIGIPASAIGGLFNPFTQVIRPGGRMHEGTGLGLAISRNLARALGGDITVVSEVGQGSRFEFWLPLVAQEVDVASASATFRPAHVNRALGAV